MFLKSSSKCHPFGDAKCIILTPVFASLNERHEWLAGNKTKSSPKGLPGPPLWKGGARGCGTEVVFHTMRVQGKGIPKPVRLNSIIQNIIKKKNLHLFTFCSVPHFISNFPLSPPSAVFTVLYLYLGTWATAICRLIRDGTRIRTQVPGTTKLGFS